MILGPPGRLSATDVDPPLFRVLGSFGSRFLGLLDPTSVPDNQNKPQHRQKALPAPPACLAGTLYIFLHIPSPYTRRSPSPGLLAHGETVAYRSRRQTELQQRALRHRAPLVAHRLPSCEFLFASTAIAIVVVLPRPQSRSWLLGASASFAKIRVRLYHHQHSSWFRHRQWQCPYR